MGDKQISHSQSKTIEYVVLFIANTWQCVQELVENVGEVMFGFKVWKLLYLIAYWLFLHKMWCVMNKCQHQFVCYGLYPSSACLCQEEIKMSACMSYLGIIFRPRLFALFSFFSFYCQFNQFTTYCKLERPRMFLKARMRKNGLWM